jgi:hypothetical protein
MLVSGDNVPHFDVTSIDGRQVRYASIWQRRNLVLIVLPAADGDSFAGYVADLLARRDAFDAQQAECVITRDDVGGLPPPGALVADRWGEIACVVAGPAGMPRPDELLAWVEHVRNRCPECEGEAQ